jgi:hypothetical protein
MTNPHANWDLPVDPDTDAAGDRGYGNEGFEHDTLPDQDQGTNSSEVSEGQTEFDVRDREYDDGDYVGTDFDQWHELGFDLPRNPRENDD